MKPLNSVATPNVTVYETTKTVTRKTCRERLEDLSVWVKIIIYVVLIVLVVVGGLTIYHFVHPLIAAGEVVEEDIEKVNNAVIGGVHAVAHAIEQFAGGKLSSYRSETAAFIDRALKTVEGSASSAHFTKTMADLTRSFGVEVKDADDWAVRQVKVGLWTVDCMFRTKAQCYKNYFDKFKLCGGGGAKDCVALSQLAPRPKRENKNNGNDGWFLRF